MLFFPDAVPSKLTQHFRICSWFLHALGIYVLAPCCGPGIELGLRAPVTKSSVVALRELTFSGMTSTRQKAGTSGQIC